jgi:hypothetical protein
MHCDWQGQFACLVAVSATDLHRTPEAEAPQPLTHGKGLAVGAGLFCGGEPTGALALLALRLPAGVPRPVLQPVATFRATDALHSQILPTALRFSGRPHSGPFAATGCLAARQSRLSTCSSQNCSTASNAAMNVGACTRSELGRSVEQSVRSRTRQDRITTA